jgi:hypothetical protein
MLPTQPCSIRYADYLGLLEDPREEIESTRSITLQRIFHVRQRQYREDALRLYSEWVTHIFPRMNRWTSMSRFIDEHEDIFPSL